MAAVSVIREAANKSAVRLGYSLGMKEEQMKVVVAFMTGKDVFAVLPTEFMLCLPAIRLCRGREVGGDRKAHCGGCYSINCHNEGSGKLWKEIDLLNSYDDTHLFQRLRACLCDRGRRQCRNEERSTCWEV